MEGNKIHPTEIGVLITDVYKPTTHMNEIFKDTLGECLQCTIRWQRRLLRGTQGYATNNVADATQIFEFSEDEVGNGTPTTTKTHRTIALESVVGSNSSPIPDFNCPIQDGLSTPLPRRSYSMSERRPIGQCPRRLTREDRNNKVTLRSVELLLSRNKCSRKCLSKVSEMDILNYWYRAWKPNKFEERRKWILSMLHEAKVESTKPRGRPSFATKLVGHIVCNNCYADAIGYSQRQFKYLKRSNLTHERSSGQHGNSDRSRELSHVATCRVVMEAIFVECGCPQPHRHAKRLSSKE